MDETSNGAASVARRRRDFKPLPSIARLHELFELRPDGTLIWRWRRDKSTLNNHRDAGSPAGTRCKDGRVTVFVDGRVVAASRVVWAMRHGVDPGNMLIDHANRRPDDDSASNIRAATRSQNNHNTRPRKDNSSGLRGVSWNKQRHKWSAAICADGKQRHIGLFSSKDEAFAAYKAESLRLFGEFSPFYDQ